MSDRLRAYGLSCLLLLVAATGLATTIVMPTDEQLIAKSPVIVEGIVESTGAVDRSGMVWTETRVRVERAIKGSAAGTIVVSEPGGILEDRITMIYGAPEYGAGERVLLFLDPTPRGDYRTMDLFVGKFAEGETTAGQRLWIRNDEAAHVKLLDASFNPIATADVQRDAAKFETYVDDRVAGRAGNANYGVATPVIKHRLEISANFTLISEPTVYRWFAFDNGGTANWYSNGTQPGYGGGGIAEVQTAMSQWNGYAEAKISYTYAGSQTGTPGGLSARNSINEVILNDPLGEIAGSWNRSTGGVVGQGGFTGVSSGGNWTAPFAADAAHPGGTMRAWNITEGNLVIQDGVSPTTGISSARLAEIISHEFGHTLGFGHSPDANALMYATVSGLGPSLRDDDRLAARWLYPSGAGSTPALQLPAAPSALAASVSGTSVVLNWTDNATTETHQSIYVAAGSGSFSRVADVATNARTATLNGFTAGTYRIYVVAVNAAGESAPSNTVTVTIATTPQPALTAVFAFSPASPTVNDTVSFTDQTTGGVTSWYWTFGDGATSSLQNPSHRFTSAGTYTVTLYANRNAESSVASRTIAVTSGGPQASSIFETLVSATAQTSGVGGTSWRTELTLFNAGVSGVYVDFIFLPTDGGIAQRRIFVGAKQSVTYANALAELYGMSSGAGAIAIRATDPMTTPKLKVSSRTFTSGAIGTYGQGVPDVTTGELAETLYVTGMQSNAAYRTNIGLVNRTDSPVPVTLTLTDAAGATIATASQTLPNLSFRQTALVALFPATSGRTYDALSLSVRAAIGNAVSAYASVVDNVTQDPIYVQAVPAKSGSSMIVPVVGRAAGANGTYWRSDVTLFNPTSELRILTLRCLGTSKSLALGGGDTFVLADVVAQMGSASGSGTLEIFWSGGTGPVVTSRTYTTVASGGTFGQSIDPASFAAESFVPGLRMDAAYRSNAGFVNGGDAPISVEVRAVSPLGVELGRTTVNVPAKSQVQYAASALFAGLSGTFTLHATASTPTLFAYGSMVDNESGDPVFFAGR